MKKYLVFLLLLACSTFIYAYEPRDLLQKTDDQARLQLLLLTNQKWVPFPAYNDRAGWDTLTGEAKKEIISKGEAALNYQWQVVTASEYLEFDKSGSRKVMQDPYWANNEAIVSLVLAELAEGKGRFLNKIADGIWFYCEMTSWAESAHVAREQKEKTSLPGYKENIIDLTTGDMGSFFAWTYYFLKDEINKVQPMISERLRVNLQKRILDPYMNRTFWWMATNATPSIMVNNWNVWCNFNVLSCFLLLENDPQKLAEAVHRTMVSVDQYINYIKEDGACEEGTSYWGHAAGKLYDYLQILYLATAGKVSLFDQPMIRSTGEYIVKSYIGNGWVVNFADASAKGGGEPGVIFNFGKAVGSQEMQQFASYLINGKSLSSYYYTERDMFRILENLSCYSKLTATKPALVQSPTTWYPQTEVCYLHSRSGFFFAAKGGNNNESHNHNDVGSFILYLNQTPVFIDAGVGTYTRQTFSDERYSIWTMQSNYHNLPMINGIPESPGAEFHSRNVEFNASRQIFSLDLAGAYPQEASVEKWQRTYKLDSNKLTITDDFRLIRTIKPNEIHFLSWVKPRIFVKGYAIFEKDGTKITLSYNPSLFDPVIETIPLDDQRLSSVWGEAMYRLSLIAKKQSLSGKYVFIINK